MSTPHARLTISPPRFIKDKPNKFNENFNKPINSPVIPRPFCKYIFSNPLPAKKNSYIKRKMIELQEKMPLKCIDAYNREKLQSNINVPFDYLKNFKVLQPNPINFMDPVSFYKEKTYFNRKNPSIPSISPIRSNKNIKNSQNHINQKKINSRTPEPRQYSSDIPLKYIIEYI